MEELMKNAVEKIRKEMGADHKEGYECALKMVADGDIDLTTAQGLITAEEPAHEEFIEHSKEYIQGFICALGKVLEEAKKRSAT
jgi:hypothetical protein